MGKKSKANVKQNNCIDKLIKKLVPKHVTEWQYHLMNAIYNSDSLQNVRTYFNGVVSSIDPVLEIYEKVWLENEQKIRIEQDVSNQAYFKYGLELSASAAQEWEDEIWQYYSKDVCEKILTFLRTVVPFCNESRGKDVKSFFTSVGVVSAVLEESYSRSLAQNSDQEVVEN